MSRTTQAVFILAGDEAADIHRARGEFGLRQAPGGEIGIADVAYLALKATTWKDPSHAEFLTSLAQITSAAQAGKIRPTLREW